MTTEDAGSSKLAAALGGSFVKMRQNSILRPQGSSLTMVKTESEIKSRVTGSIMQKFTASVKQKMAASKVLDKFKLKAETSEGPSRRASALGSENAKSP